jgi:enoyl-[acyl-carrier protein] reductase II
LGVIETSSGETENCQAEIKKMAALGLPFGVNLPIRFLKDDAMLNFVCASGVKFVTTSAGSPAKFITFTRRCHRTPCATPLPSIC